MQAVLTEQDDS